jgi:hypothetical protein
MARLSVEAFQVSFTDVAVGVVAARLPGTVGAVVSMVQLYVAGDGSSAPFHVAYTENVWEPAARLLYAFGLVHEPAVPKSSLQVKVDPPFVDEKVKLGAVLALGFVGELVMAVSGAEVGALAPRATVPDIEDATRLTTVAASSRYRRRVRALPIRPVIDIPRPSLSSSCPTQVPIVSYVNAGGS